MKKKKKLTSIISGALFWTAIFTAIISLAVSTGMVIQNAYEGASNLLKENIADVSQDISDGFMERNMESATELKDIVWNDMSYLKRCSTEEAADYLNALMGDNNCDEINIVDADGIISSSTSPANVGFDFHSDDRTTVFLDLLQDQDTCAQEPRRSLNNTDVMMAFAGAAFPDKSGFLQVGVDMDTFEDMVIVELPASVRNRRIGEDGFLMVCNSSDLLVVADSRSYYSGKSLDEYREEIEKAVMNEDVFFLMFDEMPVMLYAKEIYGYYIIGAYPVFSAFRSSLIILLVIFLMEAILFPIVFLVIYSVVRKKVIKEVVGINQSLERIAEGSLDERVEVRNSIEFDSLSDNINRTVDRLKEAAKKDSDRLKREIEYARSIRKTSLPGIFPAFPGRHDFGIYALIKDSKELGRDFYDFYLLSDDKLLVLIVDIAGQGISTTVFMMSVKSVLKSLTENGMNAAQAFTEANRILQENTEYTELFITATAWMGILDLNTGVLRFANAGHMRPALYHEGKASLVVQEAEILLCAKEGYEYHEQELTLMPGDQLLLYTDGVTETQAPDGAYFGEDRLLQSMEEAAKEADARKDPENACSSICLKMSDIISAYAGKSEPSDDITMMCVAYAGSDDHEGI